MRVPAELRPIVARLHAVRPAVYWADFLTAAGAAWGLFAAGLLAPARLRLPLVLLSAIALLRAVYFIHEIAHLRSRAPRGFVAAWFLLIGMPALVPPLMIGAHKQHHLPRTYGTPLDPEYAPIARWSRARIALDLISMPLVPPALVIRFGLLGPLSLLVPPLRRLVVARMSTLAIDAAYVRPPPPPREARAWVMQELAVAAWIALAAATLPLPIWLHAWAVLSTALLLNQIRTYAAHGYGAHDEPMSFDAQVRDTSTLRGSWLTELIAPLGDRYHALHHRFPAMPYHALPKLHALLDGDPSYAITYRDGLLDALKDRRRSSGSEDRAGTRPARAPDARRRSGYRRHRSAPR